MTRQQHIHQSNVKMSFFALCSNNNNNALQHQQTSVTGWWQCKWKQHQQQWHNVLGRPQATVLFKGIASHGSTFPRHSETQTDGPAQCTMTRSRLSSGFTRFFQSRRAHSRHVIPVAVLINSLNWNWGTWHSCSKSRTIAMITMLHCRRSFLWTDCMTSCNNHGREIFTLICFSGSQLRTFALTCCGYWRHQHELCQVTGCHIAASRGTALWQHVTHSKGTTCQSA